MTEEEAKSKWCPFSASRVVSRLKNDGEAYTAWIVSQESGDHGVLCIGSDCMAWRETEAPSDPLRHNDGSLTYAKPAHGFCGLAGSGYT